MSQTKESGLAVSSKKQIIADLEAIVTPQPWHASSNLKDYIEKLKREWFPTQRTIIQNNSLHRYFSLLADALNEGGFSVQLVLKEKMELDWDAAKVKELLWRPAQQAILNGKKSTTELNKLEDIDKVYDHLNRHLSEKFWVTVPFPNRGDKSD